MTLKIFLHLVLIVLNLLPLASLQISNNTKTCSEETLAAKTAFDFWHESTQDCEIDAQHLAKIHRKISQHTIGQQNHDKISDLLQGHVSSALMQTLFTQLIGSISTRSFSTKPNIENVINQLYEEQDKSFIVKIWQKVLDETFVFMNEVDILQQILMLANDNLKLNLLEYLLKKYENGYRNNEKFLPFLAFGVASVLKQRQQSLQNPLGDPSIGRLLSKLPEQLLIIFQSWNYNVSILNIHYNEYIFPERHNGQMGNKRYLYNFLPRKNTFRVKGKFKLQFKSNGFLAIGAPYDSSYKYLTAEEKSAFICLDCVIDAAQWWQILWPFNAARPADQQFVLFQNVATKELLCSTSIFDENFVLISVLDYAQHQHDSQCHWKVVKSTR